MRLRHSRSMLTAKLKSLQPGRWDCVKNRCKLRSAQREPEAAHFQERQQNAHYEIKVMGGGAGGRRRQQREAAGAEHHVQGALSLEEEVGHRTMDESNGQAQD